MYRLFSTAIIAAAVAVAAAAQSQLVILHTNDTHSQIDADPADGLGGVARRKVLVDSVRQAEPYVLLVDAGDAVQGTLYFNLYKGEAETVAMNALGYDLRILGNHEFDNGMAGLQQMVDGATAQFIGTNYGLRHTGLDGKFAKYAVKEVDGHRVGFMGINLRPKGMVSEGNYDGVEYVDAVEAANHTAWWLRNIEGCDMVVALTHIGYRPSTPPGDVTLAKESRGIDVIIGGHSHDLIDPRTGKYVHEIANADGIPVLVAQSGKSGKYLGQVTLELDSLKAVSKVIAVDSRLDGRTDPAFDAMLQPYRQGIDSLMRVPIGKSAIEGDRSAVQLLNFAADAVYELASQMAPGIDLAIFNKGGIRQGLAKGAVTEGQILTMLPFNNRIDVIDITGDDLYAAFEQMARVGGNGVSRGVKASFKVLSFEPGKAPVIELGEITIAGKPLDRNRTYRVATIDYLANGGDYMESLARHTLVAESKVPLNRDIIRLIKDRKGKAIDAPSAPRFVRVN